MLPQEVEEDENEEEPEDDVAEDALAQVRLRSVLEHSVPQAVCCWPWACAHTF